MDPKQPNLNGAYYGPPIPPQPQSYNNIGRRSSCGPCSCLCSLLKALISIIVILGIVVLVLWLVFRPNEIKVYVTSADLSQFNLTNNNNLQYNLSLNMSIRNPNKRIGIYYDYMEARAIYDGSRFGYTNNLPTFYQGHKNTSDFFPVFQGQSLVFGDSLKGTYGREKGEGFYYVEVKVYMWIRLKVSIVKIRAKPHVDCTLKLPVPGSGAKFEETSCDVDYF
ncbi:uncharacterized protein A4U43_C04F7310 [Asparagus officinalis]|uniref:Late embryogenesis abundant protein LEA-2 subgroup domain-containing protein n=1 Tax=Asparagus officinalis TaxID=4686 RepID=A0A5P1EZL4_ASPOF|nr:NDR1/HIN1-like protein 3 [Asparagus officinalis]ONK71324.1 uncharacterized protein A4U43_C04F7310 [Asparagus officinalis]